MIARWKLGAALAAWACAGISPLALAAAPPPKLIVAISVDQFSANLFEQYRPTFSGGLGRLASEGVVFANGYQSHAATETCPGHSTLLTGRHPSATGIIANNWTSGSGVPTYCVSDSDVVVPESDKPRGPANLRVSTLGEWLRKVYPESKTVAVAGKDRAAITMAGHDPTAVFWWEDPQQRFSTYGRDAQDASARLKPVTAYNEKIRAAWAKTPPQWGANDERCAALDGAHRYGDMTIDHRVPSPPQAAPGEKAFNDWLRASPELDRITLELATQLIDTFELGKKGPDLLAISLSATDYVGHRYGNQGPEMCEQLAQLDRRLGDFLDKLDARKVPYLVVLSADHGALDAAERVAERGVDAHRVDADDKEFVRNLNDELGASLPDVKISPLLYGDQQALYLNAKITGKQREAVMAALRKALAANNEIEAVFDKRDVLAVKLSRATPVDELSLIERYAESVDAERSGDLLLAWKPYRSFGLPKNAPDYIAGHGSPWNYDRRVPIVFWWPGMRGFEQALPIETVDIAPTLAAIVGVATPDVDGSCRDLDRGAPSTCRFSKNVPARR